MAQDKYGGFMSPLIARDYLYYAEVLFRELGDLVDSWMTFNEVCLSCMPVGETGGPCLPPQGVTRAASLQCDAVQCASCVCCSVLHTMWGCCCIFLSSDTLQCGSSCKHMHATYSTMMYVP